MNSTYLNLIGIIIDSPIRHTDQARLLHNSDKSRTDDQRLRSRDDAEQIPPRSEADGFLKAAGADVADGAGAGVGEKQDGDGGLFEGEEKADVRVEAGKDNVAFLAEVVDFGQDAVDEGVEFHRVRVHFLFFALVEHGVLFCGISNSKA